jgi:diguanylate cyclase (GGDEF)-like protein/PAS domain S-box-containing protein
MSASVKPRLQKTLLPGITAEFGSYGKKHQKQIIIIIAAVLPISFVIQKIFGGDSGVFWSSLIFGAFCAANVALAFVLSRYYLHNRQLSRAWLMLSASFACFLLGNIFKFLFLSFFGANGANDWINLFYLSSLPFLAAGLCEFQSGSKRLAKEQIRQLGESRFRSLVQNSSDVISIVGADLTIRYVTPSIERVFGFLPEDVKGKKIIDFVHPEETAHAIAHFKTVMKNGGLAPPVEWRLRNSEGNWIYVENTINNLLNDESVRGIVINSRNVTDRRRAEDRMLYDAFHDALTGLPNRALFLDHLGLALSRAARNKDFNFAVLFLDLDRFKYVNDSLGHHAGDLLLIEAARRIERCLRPGDTVARLGGDEFTILLGDLNADKEAIAVAERIQSAIAAPFDLDGREFFSTASIGIAPGNAEYRKPDDILRDADTAMYHAKVDGKARFAVFDQAMHARAISTMETEADMRRAIERGEFLLLYQPIVSASQYTLTGFESLVRWKHPNRGMIQPDQFINLAEETGLIIPISLWILREACMQVQKWRKLLPNAPLTVSVNISSKHFQQPDLVEQVARVLAETELEPKALKLEITETAVMENTERTAEKLKGLRALGVELSLDDFGTGYSSLSYLHRFPLDTLKIDRSFVSRIEEQGEHLEIVRTIIGLAKSLGMKTIAEGVETQTQLLRLQSLGCDMAQGFFFSKPLSSKTVGEMLRNMREAIF